MLIVIAIIAKYRYEHPYPVRCRNVQKPFEHARQVFLVEVANRRHRSNYRINAGTLGEPLVVQLIDIDQQAPEIDRKFGQNRPAMLRNIREQIDELCRRPLGRRRLSHHNRHNQRLELFLQSARAFAGDGLNEPYDSCDGSASASRTEVKSPRVATSKSRPPARLASHLKLK